MVKSFEIFCTTEIDTERLALAKTEAHKHDFEELLVVPKGCIEHFIDFKSEILKAPFVSFIAKGKIHKLSTKLSNSGYRIWVLRFQSEFIAETTFQLYCYYHDYANIEMQEIDCFNRMVTLCEIMLGETKREKPDLAVIKTLLKSLFTLIGSERKGNQPYNKLLQNTGDTTFKKFLKILEENFQYPKEVNFYAKKLNMSTRNLNIICQKIMGQSILEIIENRRSIEAKNLLLNTEKTISEIGFELGYNEKAYFSNVFKKKSGKTPTQFRNEMRNLIS